jgi:citrate lyase subunit beta/citryl-CoA lyase
MKYEPAERRCPMLRSMLICNGLRPDHMQKAARLDSDGVMFELEDGIPFDRKADARRLIVEALQAHDWAGTSTFVRVESMDRGFFADDIEALVPACPTGIMLAKAESADDVRTADEAIGDVEQRHGLPVGSTSLGIVIESAIGFNNVEAIASASPRLTHVAIGEGDMELTLGYRTLIDEPGPDFQPHLVYVRSRVVYAAHSAGLLVLGRGWAPSPDIDLFGYYRDLYRMGFDGIATADPKRLAIANAAFHPSAADIKRAEDVLSRLASAAERDVNIIADTQGVGFIGEVHRGPAQRVLTEVETARHLADLRRGRVESREPAAGLSR